jgi:hypothetical protein
MKKLPAIILVLLILTSCGPDQITATPTLEAIPTGTPFPPTAPIDSTVAPEPQIVGGQWHYMFYVEPLKQLLLVNGGPESGKSEDDPLEIWGWNGRDWSLITADPNGPTWRNFAGAAYDTKRNVLIIHGGGQGRSRHFRETWEWDGQAWALRAEGDGTPKSIDGLMAFDEARDQTILFGGSDGDNITNETWAWNGTQWTLLATEGPTARFAGALMYDPGSQQVLMYGGHYVGADFQFFSDFWTWDGESWHLIPPSEANPGIRVVTTILPDPASGQLVMFGGGENFLSDMWAWDGAQWTQLTTTGMPARSGPSIGYDPTRQIFVFFGGVDAPGGRGLSDTWEWDHLTWACVSSCS